MYGRCNSNCITAIVLLLYEMQLHRIIWCSDRMYKYCAAHHLELCIYLHPTADFVILNWTLAHWLVLPLNIHSNFGLHMLFVSELENVLRQTYGQSITVPFCNPFGRLHMHNKRYGEDYVFHSLPSCILTLRHVVNFAHFLLCYCRTV